MCVVCVCGVWGVLVVFMCGVFVWCSFVVCVEFVGGERSIMYKLSQRPAIIKTSQNREKYEYSLAWQLHAEKIVQIIITNV